MNDLPKKNIGKTPMQSAIQKIKEAYIMAFVSSGLMLVLTALSFLGVINIAGFDILH